MWLAKDSGEVTASSFNGIYSLPALTMPLLWGRAWPALWRYWDETWSWKTPRPDFDREQAFLILHACVGLEVEGCKFAGILLAHIGSILCAVTADCGSSNG